MHRRAFLLLPFLFLAVPLLSQEDASPKLPPPPAGTQAVGALFYGKMPSLFLPADWTPVLPLPVPPNKFWKTVTSHRSSTSKNLTITIQGVEQAGITPSKLKDAWLADLAKAGKPGWVIVTDVKEKGRAGIDVDAELEAKDGTRSWTWLRILPAIQDRLFVIRAEAKPYGPAELGGLVAEAMPLLDTFMKAELKPADPFHRGPGVTIIKSGLKASLSLPEGWIYGRKAKEGAVAWKEPGSLREYSFTIIEAPSGQRPDIFIEEQDDKAIENGGEITKAGPIWGRERGRELHFITYSSGQLWNKRWMLPVGSTIGVITGTVGIRPSEDHPPVHVEKEMEALFQAITFGK